MNINEFSIKEKYSQKDFSEIYSLYRDKVYNFIYRRVSVKEVAEDLTSEILEKIFKTINDFQWQGITLAAWIFRIARNHLIDYYRKNDKYKRDTSLEDIINIVVSSAPSIENVLVDGETEIALFKSMRELEAEDQYLIYYKFYEEMSNKQISELLNMTESNIGTKLHRIRKKLAKFIKINENAK